MVKKNLGDLIRREAQRATPEDDSTLDVTAEEIVDVEAASEADATPARRTSLTKADLEITVKELRAAVQAFQEENTTLQEQNASLQSDLQKQTTLVEKLQGELEEAKKVILQLSESNSKPAKNTSLDRVPRHSIQYEQPSTLDRVPRHSIQYEQPSTLDRVPRHSIQQEQPSTTFTDKEIGWVD